MTDAVGEADMRRKPFPTCFATASRFRPLVNCVTMQCERLAAASRLPGEARLNQRVQGVGGDLAPLRPDTVVTHEPSITIVIVYVNVSFENSFAALEAARVEKVQKYQPLADEIRGRGYVVHVDGFVIGALGAWYSNSDGLASFLRVS